MADGFDFDSTGFKPAEVRAQMIAGAVDQPNSDEAGRAIGLSQQTGLPPAAINGQSAQVAGMQQAQQNKAILGADQGLANIATDPTHYEAMADDLPAVKAAKDAAGQESFFGNIAKAWADPAAYFSKRNDNIYDATVGQFKAGVADEAFGRQYSEFKAGIADKPSVPMGEENMPSLAGVSGVASFMGTMFNAVEHGGLAGAGIGAAAGAVTGPGAGPSALVGLGIGLKADLSTSAAGQAYFKLDQARDANGNQVPEPLKAAGAIGVGLANYFLMGKLGDKAGEGLGNLLSEGMTKALSDPVVQSVAGKALTSASKSGLTFGMINGLMTAVNEGLPQATEALSGGQFQTIMNDPKAREDFVSKIVESVKDGFLAGGGIGVVGALPIGAHPFIDQMHVAQTTSEAAIRDNAMALAEASKLKVRAPEVLARAIGNDRTIDVSAEKIQEVRQTDPKAFDYLDAKVISDAAAHGGDVPIPAGDYYAKTPAEVHEQVKDDIRGSNGLTVNEAADLHAKTQAVLTAAPQGEATPIVDRPARDDTEIVRDGEDHVARDDVAPVVDKPAHDDPIAQSTSNALQTNIEAQRKSMWLDPILTPDAAGLKAADFKRYSSAIQDLQAKIEKQVFDAGTAEAKRREAPAWKEALATEGDAAREELVNRPDIFADRLLRDGTLPDGTKGFAPKLDREASQSLMGYARDGEGGVDPTAGIDPKFFDRKDGLHPDEVAQLTGHASGIELLRDLKALQGDRNAQGLSPAAHLDSMVKAEATRRVEATHGRFDDRIMQAGIDAVMQTKQLDVLADELNAMDPASQLTRESMESNVKDWFSDSNSVKMGNTDAFQRLVGKYGEKAHSALLAGDHVEALKAKQMQMVNLIAMREAKAFKSEADRFSKMTDRYTKKLAPENVAPEYTAQIQRALSGMGLEMKRDQRDLQGYLQGKPSFDAFIEGKQNSLGYFKDVTIPAADAYNVDTTKLSVDQMRALMQGITAMDHAGRLEQSITLAGEKAALADVTREFNQNLGKRPDKPVLTSLPNMGKAWLKDNMNRIHVQQLNVERMFKWFDLHDPEGPATKIMRRIQDSKYKESDDLDRLGKKLDETSGGKDWEKSLTNQVPNDMLTDTLTMRSREFNRAQMIAVAKHMGSEVNEAKLIDGMNAELTRKFGKAAAPVMWDRGTVRDWLNTNMTKADWDHVQGTWDLFEKELWPEIEKQSWERSGVAPLKRQPRPYQTPFGEIAGGYHPLQADHLRSSIGEGVRGPFDEGNFYSATPPAGYTKAVTGAKYALNLEPGGTAKAIREVVHDLAFRDSLSDAHRFFTQGSVKESIGNAFGRHVAGEIKNWLEDVAGSGGRAAAERGANGLAAILKYERQNWGAANLVLRASAISKHGMSVAIQSGAEVGGKAWAMEAQQLLRNPLKFHDKLNDLLELSGELRARNRVDSNVIEQGMNSSFAEKPALKWLNGMGHSIFNFVDMASAAPTFSAAYKQALANGRDEDTARAMGDTAVRNAHGSYNVVDRPAVLRNQSEFLKESTVAYSFFSHMYNASADTMRTISDKRQGLVSDNVMNQHGYKWSDLFFRTLAYSVMVSAVEDLVSPTSKKKDESWAWFGAKQLLRVPLGEIPFARNAAEIITGHTQGGATPGLEANTLAATKTVDNVYRMLQGKQAKPGAIKNAANAVALVAPVPGLAQAGATAQFLWDQHKGVQHADNFGQWARGVMYGKSQPLKER